MWKNKTSNFCLINTIFIRHPVRVSFLYHWVTYSSFSSTASRNTDSECNKTRISKMSVWLSRWVRALYVDRGFPKPAAPIFSRSNLWREETRWRNDSGKTCNSAVHFRVLMEFQLRSHHLTNLLRAKLLQQSSRDGWEHALLQMWLVAWGSRWYQQNDLDRWAFGSPRNYPKTAFINIVTSLKISASSPLWNILKKCTNAPQLYF